MIKFNSLTGNFDLVNPASVVTYPIAANKGGSGIANTGTFAWGANNITVTTGGATNITWPTSGTFLSNTTKIATTLATEQMRLSYDASNYITGAVSSIGAITFDSSLDSSNSFSFVFTTTGNTQLGIAKNGVYTGNAISGFFTGDGSNFFNNRVFLGVGGNAAGGNGIGDGGAVNCCALITNGTNRMVLTTTTSAWSVPIKPLTTTVSGLPSASTVGVGYGAFVTDANATVILGLGLTVAGGGSNKVPVYSDGTNWIIG